MREILAVVLAEDRDPRERIVALRALGDYLHDEEVVFALVEAARKERTVSVRAAMLDVLLTLDITWLTRRDEYLETVIAFSALEMEPALRAAAVRRLATLAPADATARAVLAENLVQDLDEEVQRYCLAGLAGCPIKEPLVVDRLLAYARQAPPTLREDLLRVYAQLDCAYFEAGLLALLNPLETAPLRHRILTLLEGLPSLSRTVAEPLLAYLHAEPLPDLRELAVRILANGVQASPDLLEAVLDAVQASPEEAALLQAFWNRLCAMPEAIPKLQALFRTTGSQQVKLYLLQLLDESEVVALFTAAIGDLGPWVRLAAVRWCKRHARQYSGAISQALATRIPVEHITHLRAEMIGVLGAVGRLDAATERAIVRWLPEEVSPEAQQILASILPEVAVTDENRGEILRAYLKVLREPFFDEALKAKVGERLRAFSYQDEPDLIACLVALLERATDLIEVERLYAQLSALQQDFLSLASLVRNLFYRFIGQYPQALLDQWLRSLANASAQRPDIRAEIPYMVRLTGASWILDKAAPDAQKAALLPTLLEAVRHNRTLLDAQCLLDDAYKRRTLRKSDAIALFKELLTYHDQYPLLDSVLRMLQEAKIVTADIVESSLLWLCRFPGASATYNVQQYLLAMGPLEPSYVERLSLAFSAETYRRFCLLCAGTDRHLTPPRGWDEYWSPPFGLRDWPIAALYFAQASPEALADKLDTAPIDRAGEDVAQSFAYLILAHLNRRQSLDEPLLLAVGRLMRRSSSRPEAETLYDRALNAFDRHWPAFSQTGRGTPLHPELARMAAEAFVALCVRRYALGPAVVERDPAPLTGMDLDHCRAIWPLSTPDWEALWGRYAGYLQQPTPMLVARPWAASPGRPRQTLGFSPLDQHAHEVLLDFLLHTPLGSDPLWTARWQRMLRAAQWHGSFERLLAELPEERRRQILALLA